MSDDLRRYHRQMLLPGIGESGQRRLGASRVLLAGCGALGCVIADTLVRAGVGVLRIVDRDVVESTNLQRQTLYTEADAAEGVPKAEAARRRLSTVNSGVRIEPVVADLTHENLEALAGVGGERVSLIMDGLDNFETRYLLNDVAVKHGIPYVYGGAVGMTGAVYPVLPATEPGDTAWERAGAAGPDLEMLFPEVPAPGTTPTCDTAGVLGPLISIVAGHQAAEAIKILTGQWSAVMRTMLHVDLMTNRVRSVDVSAMAEKVEQPRRFRHLEGQGRTGTAVLCGRHAVQLSSASRGVIDLEGVADRLSGHGSVTANRFLVRVEIVEGEQTYELTVFSDGRAMVRGTEEPSVARAVYARYLGG
ncbi:ThiF family adenylyltransferase [Mucisphaera calidilacus]|uniref:Putative adenylyltransferase/sulfurtransferase MoeZ n=1 Tax=Mucisphaera calidilacus TaxID=2527982 RepID=A0A518BXQ7_9BACT|nr:ThiF family adenylyltransferase [Mucisphaera calidilacus]QDU71736.1 putative adenylyltransferase/sulfurtransferase MoeZ [Mucisphaera calidilacus]